jgi:hypothetical protein
MFPNKLLFSIAIYIYVQQVPSMYRLLATSRTTSETAASQTDIAVETAKSVLLKLWRAVS